MTKLKKSADPEVGFATDESRRGFGLFALLAVLTILGIAIWLVVNNEAS